MLSFLRGAGPVRTNTAAHNPVVYEDGRSSLSFRAPGSEYCMTHVLPPTTAAHGASLLTPPLHYHIHQDEFFRVRRGVGHFYRGLAAAPFAVLTGGSSSGSDDDDNNNKPSSTTSTNKAMVKAGRYHRFENASPTEALVVDVHLAPEAYEAEQRFFRNFFGYLDDCRRARVAPSPFQLLVFLHAADTPLAVPLPWSEALGRAASRVLLVVAAAWGRWALGYGDSYPEYYEQGRAGWLGEEEDSPEGR